MDLFDADAIERVESELDAFVERRAREARDAEAVEALWAESVRADRERRREENRHAWREFHLLLATNHAALCEEHRQKAAKLGVGGDAVA